MDRKALTTKLLAAVTMTTSDNNLIFFTVGDSIPEPLSVLQECPLLVL